MQKLKEFDFVIIGSGFGGSVSAMRLSQKGYSVALVEQGRDYSKISYPKTNWDLKNYLWAPIIRCFGIQKISLLKKLLVLHGVGVGGGSLVYANTLLRPPARIFSNKFWPIGLDWNKELEEHYEMAEKMLGATKNENYFDGEDALEKLSKDLGVHSSFGPTNVGVYFDKPDQKVSDPYFNGDGPERVGCNFCGSCMIGCPNGAKNTLDKNYLYFARQWGISLFAENKVEKIEPLNPNKNHGHRYVVHLNSSTKWLKTKQSLHTKNVIISAGVLGSLKILFKNKNQFKTLPYISDFLGKTVRSNGESLLGATALDDKKDYSKGLAIGAQFKYDEFTKIEGVRYPSGSDFMKLLTVPLTGAGNFLTRPLKLIFNSIIQIFSIVKLHLIKDWAHNTIILLVMQSHETKMKISFGRSFLTMFRKDLKGDVDGQEVKSYMQEAQDAAKVLAGNINGVAQNCVSEVLLQTPATAHILGGAIMGNDPSCGVIDLNHQVFGYEGLYVCDASVIPVNLEVNPSLTITAMAERFCSQFPIKNNYKELNFSPKEHK